MARARYYQLSPLDQEKYDAEINGYDDRRWWYTWTQPSPDLLQLPPAPVFGVESRGKVRVVGDFRSCNSAIGKVSSKPANSSSILWGLILFGARCLGSNDCRQAFYRLASNIELQLHSHNETFGSQRVVFGVSWGPASLDGCLSPAFTSILEELGSAGLLPLLFLFVDDYVSAERRAEAMVTVLTFIEEVLARLGFSISDTKGALLFAENPPIHLDPRIATLRRNVMDLLGTRLSYSPNDQRLIVDCCRGGRLSEAETLLSKFDTRLYPKEVFALAGFLGYDPIRQHWGARALADAWRRWAGCQVDGGNWNAPLVIRDPDMRACLDELLRWTAEVIRDGKAVDGCHHDFPTYPTDTELRISVFVDASLSGWGAMVGVEESDGRFTLLSAEAKMHSLAERRIHVNRRELNSVVQGLVSVSNVLNQNRMRIASIRVFSDSTSARGWAENAPSRSRVTSRRAIHDALTTLRREVQHLEQFGPVQFHFTPGSTNRADEASRAFDRPLKDSSGKTTTLSHILSGAYRRQEELETLPVNTLIQVQEDDPDTPVPDPADMSVDDICTILRELGTATETVGKVREVDMGSALPLAERIASPNLLPVALRNRFRQFWHSFRMWRAITKRARPLPTSPSDPETERMLFQSIQSRTFVPPNSPLVQDERGLLIMSEDPSQGRIYIPPEATNFRSILISHMHLTAGHAGTDEVIMRLRAGYFLPRLRSAVKYWVDRCLSCQCERAERGKLKRASHSAVPPLSIATEHPYSHSEVDIISVVPDFKVLCILCKATGHVSLYPVASTRSADAIQALREHRLDVGSVKKYYTDNATTFTSREFSDFLVASDSDLCLIGVRSSFEIPRSSRIHFLSLKILRRVLGPHGSLPADTEARRLLLKYISLILNTRPLVGFPHYVSPDLLAWGFTRQLSGAAGLIPRLRRVIPRAEGVVSALRQQILTMYWQGVRDTSLVNMAQRKNGRKSKTEWAPAVGDQVLVYSPRDKSISAWRIGIVEGVQSRRATVLTKDGHSLTTNLFNIAPLLVREGEEGDLEDYHVKCKLK